MLKLTSIEQDLLYTQAELKKLEDNSYLEDEQNDNFKYIRSKFFSNETIDKAKLLNVGSGIFGSVANAYASYVGNPSLELGVNFRDLVQDIATLGFCCMAIERQDGDLQLVYQPAKSYLNRNGIDNIIRFYVTDDLQYFTLVQEYGVGYIKNTLYKTPSQYVIQGEEVPLATIPQTAELEPVIDTGLETSALLVTVDQIPSMTQRIRQLVYAVDRHIVMNHTQYLENVESFVLLRNITLPGKFVEHYSKGKKVNFSELGRILQGGEDSAIEFVKNANDMIESCITDNENFVRRISAISFVPPEFLGLETKEGAIGEGSRTLKQGSFIKKIQSIRDLLDETIAQALEIIGNEELYTWPDIFAKSSQELATELATARSAKLISLYNAVKKYNDFTDEEAEEEVARIQEEDQQAMDLATKSKEGQEK